MTEEVPVLLPRRARIQASKADWQPSRYKLKPIPPPEDEAGQLESNLGYKPPQAKKTTERRGLDPMGPWLRWYIERGCRTMPNGIMNYLRPSPNHVIELLPPEAYGLDTAVCIPGKFFHSAKDKDPSPNNCLCFTPNGRRLLSGYSGGSFILWNSLSFNWAGKFSAHQKPIQDCIYTRSGNWILSVDQGGHILYHSDTYRPVLDVQGHDQAIWSIAISPDDSKFVTASDDRTCRIWDLGQSTPVRELQGHANDVKCTDWHPSRGLIVSGARDGEVKFWDPRTATAVTTLNMHRDVVQDAKFSPDGNICATAGRDQAIRLFDLRKLQELRVLKGHKDHVICLAWHPTQHSFLASGGKDRALFFWDSQSTGALGSIDYAHDGPVTCLAWHPIGHVLASGSMDCTTRFWHRERPGVAVGRDRYHLGLQRALELGIKEEQRGGQGPEDSDEEQGPQRLPPGLQNRQNGRDQRDRGRYNGQQNGHGGYGSRPPGLHSDGPPGLRQSYQNGQNRRRF